MNHKNGRIDKDRLKELWNFGKSITEIAEDMQVSDSAVSQMVSKLGLKNKSERIQIGVETSIAKKVFYNSEKLYEDGIDMVATAKRMLSRLEAIIELNTAEIKNTNVDDLSRETITQQNQIIKAIYSLSTLLKTLMSYEETLLSVHQYNTLKNAIIDAAERAGYEMRQIFLKELHKADMQTRYLFGDAHQHSNYLTDDEDHTYD